MRTSLSISFVLIWWTASAQVIVTPSDAPANVSLAAKEIRRYVYLRTGKLLSIGKTGKGIELKIDPALGSQTYRLKSGHETLTLSGGSDVAVLYGAYAFAEKLGVRFQLDSDTIPDEQMPLALPVLDETHAPLFTLRGLQPFHDFPEGPDWWTTEDWKSVVHQAAKMRMNFIGLHTYPFHDRNLGPEPTVWVGLPEDVNPDGTVKTADYASWYTTAKSMPYGCYAPMKTADYDFGGAAVFPSDDYGPEVNGPDDFPMPKTPAASVAMVNRTGAMLNEVFTQARRMGMKIAVGTESPLDVPDTAKARLLQAGLKADDPASLRKLYAGMFTRIRRAYPVDYYWLWGHEGEIDQARFLANLEAARAALQESQAPFGLGICGWGWITGNFPALDTALPKDVAFSAMNMSAGHSLVSPNFEQVEAREKWAIPWIEDDSVLTSIQLRAGRVRRDAVDAHRYGCNGLMGVFWRTRILSPNLAALAQSGWEQGAWSQPSSGGNEPREVEVSGGQTAAYLNDAVSGTDNTPLYQTLRYGLRGYRFTVPNGDYTVTLRFSEPVYQQAGKRVFGVKLQGQAVVKGLDIFARVGQFAALDLTFTNIVVTRHELRIDFVPEVELPSICAIEIAGSGITRKVNCGGPEYQGYAADVSPESAPRDLPVADLYADWATAQFGPEAGPAAAAIFSRLDGNFPATSGWIRGPGAIVVNPQPWAQIAPRFDFVDQFAALRPRVQGAGSLERFNWWLNTFRATRSMGQFGCARGELDAIMARIAKETDPEARTRLAREQALPVRLRMVELLGDMHNALLASLNNSTELGTLCNIEQQSLHRLKLLTGHDAALEKILAGPLPAEAHPWKEYRGAPRLVVVNARMLAHPGETLKLRIIALDRAPVRSVSVRFRPLGGNEWKTLPATHLARAVYEAILPPAQDDFEYYIISETAAGQRMIWPAAAPKMNQTIVINP